MAVSASKLRRLVALTTACVLAAPFASAGGAAAVELGGPGVTVAQLLKIAGVDLPPAGTNLRLHIDFPAERPLELAGTVPIYALTATITPDGIVRMENAVTAGSAGTDGLDECSDPYFTPTGPRWDASDLPIKWRFRRGSSPSNVGLYRTQRSLRGAHRVWPKSETNCDAREDIGIGFTYAGLTSRKVDYDSINVVEFGPLDGGALAVNYTWYTGGKILEVDLRFNKADYRWTNRPGGRNRYQIKNVATHELGHQLGLDDLSDPHGSLTMFGRISKGETNKMTLGNGDMRGAAALSP